MRRPCPRCGCSEGIEYPSPFTRKDGSEGMHLRVDCADCRSYQYFKPQNKPKEENVSTEYDTRFDEAEQEADRGTPWRFREPNAPNPLTIKVIEWSTGVTKLGEAEFLNGTDRDGKRWSVLVGAAILQKQLIDGIVEQWDNDRKEFVEITRLGRVQPGDVVAISYTGDRQGAKYDYPTFRISRKPAMATAAAASSQSDDISY